MDNDLLEKVRAAGVEPRLTRDFLRDIGIEDENHIDAIMAGHSETVKFWLSAAGEEKAAQEDKQDEEPSTEDTPPVTDWKAEYKRLRAEYDSLTRQIAEYKAYEKKTDVFRQTLRKIGVYQHADTIIRGSRDIIEKIDLEYPDPAGLEAFMRCEFADFIHK